MKISDDSSITFFHYDTSMYRTRRGSWDLIWFHMFVMELLLFFAILPRGLRTTSLGLYIQAWLLF